MLPFPTPIPIVSPITIGDAKFSGRTKPLQMICESPDGKADYIVKLWANPEVYYGKSSLAREIFGNLLARSLGLFTPDIAIVEIEPNFYIHPSHDQGDFIRKSIGFNFGSKYIPGATIFNPPLKVARQNEAIKIFCFDMLIGNVDRRPEKPNMFDLSNGLWIFDHEQAFPFSRPQSPILGIPPGWEFIREQWHKDHILFPYLRNQDCALDIEDFVTSVGYISDELLDTIEWEIPEDWHIGDDLKNIKDYLANTRDNLDKFKRSLQEILA